MSNDEIGNYFRAQNDWRTQITPLNSASIYPGYMGRFLRPDGGARVLDAGKWGYPTTKPRVRPPKEGQDPFVILWWQNARALEKSFGRIIFRVSHIFSPRPQLAEEKAARTVGSGVGCGRGDPILGRFATVERGGQA